MENDSSFHHQHTELILNVMMVVSQARKSWLVGRRSGRDTRRIFASRVGFIMTLLSIMVVTMTPGAFVDNHTVAKIFKKESQENPCHGNCGGCPFILKTAQTGIGEHELSVGEELRLLANDPEMKRGNLHV